MDRETNRVKAALSPPAVAISIAMALTAATGFDRTLAAAPASIPCPQSISANGLLNTHSVPQFLGASTVPFTSVAYEYKRGDAFTGSAWYWPDPRTTVHQGFHYEWMGAGVKWTCWRTFFPPIAFDTYFKTGIEGHALVLPDAGGPSSPDEEWRGGEGYVGGGGRSPEEECYEIWYVWTLSTGEVYDEEYVGDVCFQNGHMT